jgi:1-aminocyclopropane-1-carboxylate synthase
MLSKRGATSSSSRKKNFLWEVMSDPYRIMANPSGYINLGVAENTSMHDELIQQMRKTFEPPGSTLSYGEGLGGGLRLRKAIAAFVNQFFFPVILVWSEHITVSNGVTSSIERCAFGLGDPGDYFLLGRPFYGSFPSELRDRAEVDTLPVAFGGIDPFSTEAAAQYEDEIVKAKLQSKTVRALLLCSPHNPLGRCYPRKTLVALMRLCQKYSIHLIVDKIYALSVFVNPEHIEMEGFTSVLVIETSGLIDPSLIHVLWGLSKDFGANGLRIGCVISQSNQSLVAALGAHVPYSYPSALLDYIAASLLEDQGFVEGYITENRQRLVENYIFVTEFLKQHGFTYYRGSNAGFFIWVDLGEAWLRRERMGQNRYDQADGRRENEYISGQSNGVKQALEKGSKSELTQQVMERLISQRLYLASGDAFGSESPGWFRIVFTQPRYMLCEGLYRMVRALDM